MNIQYLEAKIYTFKAKYIAHVMTSSVTFVLSINDEYICALYYRLQENLMIKEHFTQVYFWGEKTILERIEEKNFSLSCNFNKINTYVALLYNFL